MSSKSEKLKGEVRICTRFNLRWHDFTMQKNHLFGIDEKGYFVTAGEPRNNTIKVYRAQPVPAQNPDFYRWYATYEQKGSELYNKIMAFKRENPGRKVEFVPLEIEKHIANNDMRMPGKPRPFRAHAIPGGGTGTHYSHINGKVFY